MIPSPPQRRRRLSPTAATSSRPLVQGQSLSERCDACGISSIRGDINSPRTRGVIESSSSGEGVVAEIGKHLTADDDESKEGIRSGRRDSGSHDGGNLDHDFDQGAATNVADERIRQPGAAGPSDDEMDPDRLKSVRLDRCVSKVVHASLILSW